MKDKIQLKNIDGSVIFEYETEDYSIKKALEVYIKEEREKGKIVALDFINLSGVDLSGIDLSGIDLSGANLSNADLRDSNLEGADFKFANLSYSNLKDSKLSGANLSNAILNSTKNIKYATCSFDGHGEQGRQLLGVKINNETMLFCGCFKGNENELREFIENDEEKYKKSRLIALDTVLKLININ